MKTLADVAQRLGVSQATVSRAANGKSGVSESTRRAVLDAMQDMGMLGKEALRGMPQRVALVTPDLTNPIFPAFVTSISTHLARRNILPELCTYTVSGASESAFVQMVLKSQVQGVIFLAGKYDTEHADLSDYALLREAGIPAVFLNAASPELTGHCVMTDDAAGTRMAMRHLISQGHRRIGLLMGDPHHYPSLIKFRTAVEYATAHGVEVDADHAVWTTYGVESGRTGAASLVEDGATALLCASDQLALGAIKGVRMLGKSVPGDVSVVGFDDSPWLTSTSPSLTTVRQPVAAMSGAIVKALWVAMHDPSLLDQRQDLLFEPELVVRESTAINRSLLG